MQLKQRRESNDLSASVESVFCPSRNRFSITTLNDPMLRRIIHWYVYNIIVMMLVFLISFRFYKIVPLYTTFKFELK